MALRPGSALKAELIADAAVLATVGDQIFPLVADQDPKSYDVPTHFLTYGFVERFDGTLHPDSPATSAELELRCWALDYDEAHDIADAVSAVLSGFQGLMGGPYGVTVRHCSRISREDDVAEIAGEFYFNALLRFDILFA